MNLRNRRLIHCERNMQLTAKRIWLLIEQRLALLQRGSARHSRIALEGTHNP